MDAATVDGQTISDGSTGSPGRSATETTALDGLCVAPAAATTDRAAAVAAAVDGRNKNDDSAPPDSAPAATEVPAGGRTATGELDTTDDGKTPTDSIKSIESSTFDTSMATAAPP